jgi:hypothetical protein
MDKGSNQHSSYGNDFPGGTHQIPRDSHSINETGLNDPSDYSDSGDVVARDDCSGEA